MVWILKFTDLINFVRHSGISRTLRVKKSNETTKNNLNALLMLMEVTIPNRHTFRLEKPEKLANRQSRSKFKFIIIKYSIQMKFLLMNCIL